MVAVSEQRHADLKAQAKALRRASNEVADLLDEPTAPTPSAPATPHNFGNDLL